MSSGSLKDLIRAISTTVTTAPPPYPLPRDLITSIQSFLDRHVDDDESDQQRLNDELLAVHTGKVQAYRNRQLTFIAILKELKPALRGRERMMVWWDCLLQPTLLNLESTKNSVVVARELVLKMLVYDEDDDVHGDLEDVSNLFTDLLFEKYISTSSAQPTEPDENAQNGEETRFMAANLEEILLAFGKRRAKPFMTAADAYMVNKNTRLQILGLLSTFVKMQGPHLYQILETPLLDHLLLCLQMDTSTTVVSLALTTLLMFMPHIPNALASYLPRLFGIYARLLCWDHYGVPSEKHESYLEDSTARSTLSLGIDDWQKCESSFPTAASSAPDVTELFTFLYGMYPLNFMGFLKEPYKYLDREDVKGFEDVEFDDHLIRQRSDPHRQRHLLHGNFFTLTEEKELTDKARWMKSEPSDVVAQCVGLIAPNAHAYEEPAVHPEIPGALIPTEEIPTESLLGEGSQRDTSEDEGIGMDNHRLKAGHHANGKSSRGSTPGMKPVDPHNLDSPTLPPSGPPPSIPKFSEERLQDMVQLHGSLNSGKINGSSASLTGTIAHDPASPRLKAYVQSLTIDNRLQSPALRPAVTDSQGMVAYLQRENILLKNDLNFERYLKQQHLAHIGSLQRKHIKDASIEAETNNLINTNKALKRKIEDSAKAYQKLREEGTKTKLDARKWEAELNNRIQKLREEKKVWKEEEESVKNALSTAHEETTQLRKLVVDSEAKELQSRQRMQAIEQSLADLEMLRHQNEQLNKRLREFKYTEESIEVYKEIERAANAQVDKIKLRLKAREAEREKMKRAYEERMGILQNKLVQAQNERDQNPTPQMQEMIDSALQANTTHLTSMKKAYNQLLMRFTELEIKYIELQASNELDKLPQARNSIQPASYHHHDPHPILHLETDQMSGYYGSRDSRIADRDYNGQKQIIEPHSPKALRNYHQEQSAAGPSHQRSDPYAHQSYASPNLNQFPVPHQTDRRPSPVHRQIQHIQTQAPYTSGVPAQAEMSPDMYSPPVQGAGRPSLAPSSSVASHDDTVSISNSFTSTGSKEKRSKIKPQSEVRVRGRGGVQNIGKKEKEKEREAEKEKKKKSKLVAGFRGFSS
ncbi:hypothetical protein DRE_00765 [Drechslerella stenobrocha 248]|uniref:Tuberous sclerosis 1 n=1 Tax=Drechslerella stenobrocha 248 TaxID=1043628 RepID=W7HMV7_9PEZI|nr:hypothetical protein DRE_00765 [Drechslerella stenobrocha 248]